MQPAAQEYQSASNLVSIRSYLYVSINFRSSIQTNKLGEWLSKWKCQWNFATIRTVIKFLSFMLENPFPVCNTILLSLSFSIPFVPLLILHPKPSKYQLTLCLHNIGSKIACFFLTFLTVIVLIEKFISIHCKEIS